jgi:hypothetical protein
MKPANFVASLLLLFGITFGLMFLGSLSQESYCKIMPTGLLTTEQGAKCGAIALQNILRDRATKPDPSYIRSH